MDKMANAEQWVKADFAISGVNAVVSRAANDMVSGSGVTVAGISQAEQEFRKMLQELALRRIDVAYWMFEEVLVRNIPMSKHIIESYKALN